MTDFAVGQRWGSEMEPELGVGVVEAIDGRRIQLRFPESGLTRIYAAQNAPLRRVVFHPGDRVTDRTGSVLTITAVETEGGLMVYCGDGKRLREDRLADALVLDSPRDRLMAGQRDPIARFDLRRRVLEARCRLLASAVHGFVGGRVDLIPHQFAIAAEVSARRQPRVLLADETGLGKTIEAGLIVHRLSIVGRISRILVIVPDALVVQWFVELARRFNLRFRIFDDALMAACTSTAAMDNPFADEALGLCGFSFLTHAPQAARQHLIHGGWDLLVVDEAHHLQVEGPLFAHIQQLSETVHRIILITATPGHLSAPGHFARLRLLDPDRYTSYDRFRRESEAFEQVAQLVQSLADGDTSEDTLRERLSGSLGIPMDEVDGLWDRPEGRSRLMQRIIDRFGTGRSMFKTTRRSVGGFPGRQPRLLPLDGGPHADTVRRRICREALQDCGLEPADPVVSFADDPRVAWLETYLRAHRDEKILLICRTAGKVNALHAALEALVNLKIGRYHEGMTLVQRDRQAAWFAEPEGAVLLLCSEIGSEGRNFQFARRLILFDLPPDPDLLEQRIGRLDRIGQTGVVQVMVPYVRGTGGEILARWYHEALNVLQTHVPAAGWVNRRCMGPLVDLVREPEAPSAGARLGRLTRCGRIAVARQQRVIESGRDLLLQMDAMPPDKAAHLIGKIREMDADPAFPVMVEQLLDVWGIVMEPIASAIYRLTPDHRYADSLPGFRPSGLTVTTDRSLALTREELDFLTWDHPMVTGAMDHYLGSGKGNAAFACWPAAGETEIFLEMIFVIEAAALANSDMQTFLPPSPLRVVVDHRLHDGESKLPAQLNRHLQEGTAAVFARILPAVSPLIPGMIETGRNLAGEKAKPVIAEAEQMAGRTLDEAIGRLEALSRLNTAIGMREIDAAKKERDAVLAAIAAAQVRLDALRLILKGSAC